MKRCLYCLEGLQGYGQPLGVNYFHWSSTIRTLDIEINQCQSMTEDRFYEDNDDIR